MKKKAPLKILFIHSGLQSFVEKDLDILRSTHEVRSLNFTSRKGIARYLIPDLLQLLLGVFWCDLTFSWFGKLNGFFGVLFSKILGKKGVVVAGGDDVANCIVGGRPYGLCADAIGKWFAYFTFRNADLVITISEYNKCETLTNTGVARERVALVPHGFDGYLFCKLNGISRDNSVVTVATVDQESFCRKGLRLFLESAGLLPDVLFFMVGPDTDGTAHKLASISPSNVTLTGGLYGEELIALLSRCRVYVQASEWESFGCSVAEAMLCQCVPVVSRYTALPEVVGDCGIYLNELTPTELAKKIQEAQNRPELGKMARERIMRLFPLERRKQDLLRAVEEVGAK